MTSAASADCHGVRNAGARKHSASKVRTKRTVFIKVAPISKGKDVPGSGDQHQWATKYRRRMKDLRRRVLLLCSKTEHASLRQSSSTQAHRRWLSCNSGHGTRLAAQRSLPLSCRSNSRLVEIFRSNGEVP